MRNLTVNQVENSTTVHQTQDGNGVSNEQIAKEMQQFDEYMLKYINTYTILDKRHTLSLFGFKFETTNLSINKNY